MSTPKVSIILPSLNVAPFIRQCIESAIHQTLEDIEIICVDAGSTDGTIEILREYASLDSRIKILHSERKSYGFQMNLGLDAATGAYIGILETDDWAEPDMFESLWKAATETNADMVKSNYYWYTTQNGIHNDPFENLKGCHYGEVFSPLEDRTLFKTTPAIWSGIYQREMLISSQIRFNETPGASFQDTSFHFLVCTVAQRCYLLKDHFLHYRKDNGGSSVYSLSKVYCIVDEMHHYEDFLAAHDKYREKIVKFYQALKYEKYRWNFTRLPPESQYAFLRMMHKEFSEAYEHQVLDQAYFTAADWNAVTEIIQHPVEYFKKAMERKAKELGYRPTFSPVVIKQASNAAPLISVVIPIFNVEAYLAECIESVIHQSLTDLEIICINDGSMDNSLAIAENYAAADPRITVVDQINAGQSSARNVGIKMARGSHLLFIDSDDYLLPDALEKLYAYAQKWDTDILYFGAESFFENQDLKRDYSNYVNFYKREITFDEPVSGDILLQDQLKKWLFRSSVPLQFIRKSFLLETGLLFKEGIIHEDELFSCVLAAKAKRALCVADTFYMRRVRANSTMTAAYTANKFVGFFIVSTTLMSIAVVDNTLSQTAKEAILFHAQKIHKDAKIIYHNLSKTEIDKIPQLLPYEYRPYYTEMRFSFEGNNNDLLAMKKSASYKIGRVITFVPRKLKGLLQCVKDHGFGYTIAYSFKKGKKSICSMIKKLCAKVRGGIQCCIDHGIIYTIKYFFKKLF